MKSVEPGQTDRRTDRQTDRQNDYYNPLAHAPRVKYMIIMLRWQYLASCYCGGVCYNVYYVVSLWWYMYSNACPWPPASAYIERN